jgi:Cdc6-like AAA superfamily ATPase
MASEPQSGIYIGTGGGKPQILELKRANRHGLIAGATGTGKTVALQGIVEGLSRPGSRPSSPTSKAILPGWRCPATPMQRTSTSAVELIGLASTVILLAGWRPYRVSN